MDYIGTGMDSSKWYYLRAGQQRGPMNIKALQGSLVANVFSDYCSVVQIRQYLTCMKDKLHYDPEVAKTFIHLLLTKQLDMQERTLSYIFLGDRVPVSVLEEV